MDEQRSRPTPTAVSPPWWAYPLLLPAPLLAWHGVVADELAQAPDAPQWFASGSLAWAGVGALACGLLLETLVYRTLWAARGRRLPFAASALILLQLSMLEVVAIALLAHAPQAGPARGIVFALVGARLAWHGGAPGGFAGAFGSLGVLTLLRMALWAAAQAEGTRRSWREAAAMVATVWLASHVVQGMLIELVRGRSGAP